MQEDYVTTIMRIIGDSDLTKNEKLGYIYLLELAKKRTIKNPKSMEDKSYTINGKTLSDRKRLYYELSRLYEIEDENVRTKVRKILYQLERQKNPNSIEIAKVKTTKLQIKNGFTPTFYTVFQDIVNSLIEEEKKHSFKK